MQVGIGGVAALMMAFEEVDEIERMKAFTRGDHWHLLFGSHPFG
jgi:hypothetical protein